MLLAHKTAVVYGAGGAIGGATARAFARHGARVHLAGRTRSTLDTVAEEITAEGGTAFTAVVDALDEESVTRHADQVVQRSGGIDIALNAVGIPHVQGVPLAQLSLADYAHPIDAYTRTHFITAKSAARHMVERGSGVILTVSAPGPLPPQPGFMGFGVACAAIEAVSRHLAGELGPSGIRVVCLRPNALPEAYERHSHSREVFEPLAERAGITVGAMFAGAAAATLLNRLPTLEEVADTAVFMASDNAAAVTGAIANLSCGSRVD